MGEMVDRHREEGNMRSFAPSQRSADRGRKRQSGVSKDISIVMSTLDKDLTDVNRR